jgi:hypothetical protein
MRKTTGLAALVAMLALSAAIPLHSAYKGHGADKDVQALLEAHPDLRGTAADSCETCHRAGTVAGPAHAPAPRRVSHCDYCHAVYGLDGKGDIAATLNAYGLAYRAAGRGTAAVRTLAARDADADGAANEEELRQGTNPGEAASRPAAPLAPTRAYTPAELRALSPVVAARIFLNSTKSRTGDTYHDYRGNRLDQLLDAVGLAPGATSVDLLSIDGYETTITLDEVRKGWPQAAIVPGLDAAGLGTCGWVSYGPGAAKPGDTLADARVLLAFEENGVAFETARLDPASGRIVGKGPLRAVVPQFEPGPPDLPEFADAACRGLVADGQRFHAAYDHNAGKSVSAVVAIRVNPLPAGTRDVDWRKETAAAERVVIFGALARRR